MDNASTGGLTLAVMHAGDEITTIEGLEIDGDLHPMQAAFVRHDGLQCGYCPPGQICSAIALLEEHKAGWPSYATADVATAPVLTEAEIAERMSGALLSFSAVLTAKDASTHRLVGKFCP